MQNGSHFSAPLHTAVQIENNQAPAFLTGESAKRLAFLPNPSNAAVQNRKASAMIIITTPLIEREAHDGVA